MPAPTRCDCGDSECASCGVAQGTRSVVNECARCGLPLTQDERDTNGDLCHACVNDETAVGRAMECPSLDASREHYTDGRPCWCGPTIEHGRGGAGDVIIHRDKEDAH